MIDGLEADVVTLALAYDIDAIAEKAKLAARRLAEAPAAQQRALHLDHRLPGAQGQPQGHQGLGRPRQARRLGHHAEPQDLRRRALELPRGLGLRAEAARRRRGQGEGLRRQAVQERAGARLRRARLDHHLRPSAASATCCSPGRTRPSSRSRNSAPTSSRSSTRRSRILAEPPVAVVDKVVDRHGTRAVAQAYLEYLYTPEGQEIAAKNFYRPRDPKVGREVREAVSRSSSCSPSTRCSAAGQKAQKTHFADGGVFDQIYSRK